MDNRTLEDIINEEGNYKEWTYQAQNGCHFNCIIRRNFRIKHLCGYVQLTKDNKLFEKDYMSIEEPLIVHGGITYASYVEDKWFIGFDCAHFSDETFNDEFFSMNSKGYYRDMNYVTKECEKLAEQLSKFSLSAERDNKIGDCLD